MNNIINDISLGKPVEHFESYTDRELLQDDILEYAVGKANIETIEYFLKRGCKSSHALDVALDKEYEEIAELLHKHGCKPSPNRYHMHNLFELTFMKTHGYDITIDVYDICHNTYPSHHQKDVVKQLLEWYPESYIKFYEYPSSLYDETLAYLLQYRWHNKVLAQMKTICKKDMKLSLRAISVHVDMKLYVKHIAKAGAKTVKYWKERLGLSIEDFLPEMFKSGNDDMKLEKLHLLDEPPFSNVVSEEAVAWDNSQYIVDLRRGRSNLQMLANKYNLVSIMLENRCYKSLAYLLDIHSLTIPGKELVEVYRTALVQAYNDYIDDCKRSGSSVQDLYLIDKLLGFCNLFTCFVPREFLVKYSWRKYNLRELVNKDGDVGKDYLSCVQSTTINEKYHKYF